MKFQHKVSVVIPVYNSEEYLEECLNSIVNQSFEQSKLEIILVDDGSSDKSIDICEKYTSNYNNFRLILQENSGVSAARNHGMKEATGEYILFVDSDDRINNEYVEKIVEFFDIHSSDVDLVISHLSMLNKTVQTTEHIRYNFLTSTGVYEIEKYPYILPNSINICIKNNGMLFDTSLTYQEDQKLCAELISEKLKIGYVKEAEYYYNKMEIGLANVNCSPIRCFESSTKLFEDLFALREIVPLYIQALFFHDFVWKLRQNILWPYHYDVERLAAAKDRVFTLLSQVDDKLIMSYPNAQTYEWLYWLRLKRSNCTPVISENGICIYNNEDLIYSRKKIEIVLKKIRIFEEKLYIRGFLKSPIFAFGVIPELHVEVNGTDTVIACKDCGAGYYKIKEKTDIFYGFEIAEELGEKLILKFSIICDGIANDVNFYNTASVCFAGGKDCYTIGNFVASQAENTMSFVKSGKCQDEKIWLYTDASTVEIDNAYTQFVHDMATEDGVKRYYVKTNAKTDVSKFRKNQVIAFGSKAHIDILPRAEKILTSFADEAVILPNVPKKNELLGKIRAEIIYLQHGILHAHLPWYYSKYVTYVDKVVISSDFEKKNFINNYDYDESDLICSGMARFDTIKRSSLHTGKILYAPSWRSYLVKTKSAVERVGNENVFMNSNYYHGIMSLISDEKFRHFLELKGIVLDVKMHPEFFKVYGNIEFTETPNIKQAPLTIDYNAYDLIITDFSSMLFDFVYMNKPVVYYVPDINEFKCGLNHYRELDMPLEDGLGFFATDVESIVDHIIELAKNNFIVKEEYKDKYAKFYELISSKATDALYNALSGFVPADSGEEEERTEGAINLVNELVPASIAASATIGSFEDFKRQFEKFDKEHIWMFDAGHKGRREFRGNPKYLFIYINKYRPDIKAYWFCENDAGSVIEVVRSLGYIGVLSGTKEAEYLMDRTGVVVSEQVRMYLPEKLLNTKYLNLWHGIGFKRIERARIDENDDLSIGIAQKYIRYNQYLLNNQLVVVNSPIYEKEFTEDLGLQPDQLIRTGYLRCLYQSKYENVCTFDHDIRKQKGIPEDARIAVYAPTFRATLGNTFSTAMVDLEALYKVCEENNILLIFKAHPHIENEKGFINAWQMYGDRPYFLFWDNVNDFYEILHQIDLVIYDYSSIFSDFLCAGVKNYIRYIYDEDEYMQGGFTQGSEAYYERTCGKICRTYEELLCAIEEYQIYDDSEEIAEVYDKLWSYTSDDDFEKTIDAVMNFNISDKEYPTLYSFDVFDTLISRKGLHPYSIFYAVQQKMKRHGGFPDDFVERYPKLRHSAEMNVREYYIKTTDVRQSAKVEITMDEIFVRLKDVYGISVEQAELIKEWEIEEEINAVVPIKEQIDLVKEYLEAGNTVVLISDMYLPKEVLLKMLEKADPILAAVPLFVSNEYGVLKTSRLLFFEVYKSFKPFYQFGKWIHYGDNLAADQNAPRRLGIQTRAVSRPDFSKMENEMVKVLNNYDAYLVAAMQARLRENKGYSNVDFVVDFIGLALVPYVDWAIRDAINKGFDTLYFVARDGYPLKLIADGLIEENGWTIKTKYLYASRRTWRMQSFFEDIDDIFWVPQGGNFNDITCKEELFKAMYIDEDTFRELLPNIDIDNVDWNASQPGKQLAPIIKNSKAYREYLLNKSKEEREIVCEYLKQEIDSNEKFACVEYWGRGYNQECMSRLWNYAIGREDNSYYYYVRTICPTEGNCVRYNFTDNDSSLIFMESIFANMPYRSVERYCYKDGRVEPVIEPLKCDMNLYNAMTELLPKNGKEYARLGLSDYIATDRKLFDFLLNYFHDNKDDIFIAENIGSLSYSQAMYGELGEFARAYVDEDLQKFQRGLPRGNITSSISMSYARSDEQFKLKYDEMYQREYGDDKAGGVPLSDDEIKRNKEFKEKYMSSLRRANSAKKIYEEECIKSIVVRKVCVVSANKNFDSDVLYVFKKNISKQDNIFVEWISANCAEQDDIKIMKQIATAKYIIVEGNCVQFQNLSFRPKTEVICLLDRGFRLYNFGHIIKQKLIWQNRFEKQTYSLRPTMIECCTSVGKDSSFSSYNLSDSSVKKIPGACVTDVLFDEEFKKESFEKLYSVVPEARRKKVIFYIPTPRKRIKSSEWLELLDLEHLQRNIGNEYVVLLDFRSNMKIVEQCKNVIEIPGFSKNVSKVGLSIRNLMVTADIVIGDYRDTFFESALLNVPVYSTASDLDRIQSSSVNMAYDLGRIYPFPIVSNADELVENLKKEYNFSKIDSFKQQYLSRCDGVTATRLIEMLI